MRLSLLQAAHRDHNQKLNSSSYRGPLMSADEFQEKLQQICYNVAWMVFGEVNVENDTESIVDLSCLETPDAQAITKQKIYDLGKAMRLNKGMYGTDEVLAVLYSDEHVVAIEQGGAGEDAELAFENAILSTVRDELQLDHFHSPQDRTILVRINHSTLDNEVLRDQA